MKLSKKRRKIFIYQPKIRKPAKPDRLESLTNSCESDDEPPGYFSSDEENQTDDTDEFLPNEIKGKDRIAKYTIDEKPVIKSRPISKHFGKHTAYSVYKDIGSG